MLFSFFVGTFEDWTSCFPPSKASPRSVRQRGRRTLRGRQGPVWRFLILNGGMGGRCFLIFEPDIHHPKRIQRFQKTQIHIFHLQYNFFPKPMKRQQKFGDFGYRNAPVDSGVCKWSSSKLRPGPQIGDLRLIPIQKLDSNTYIDMNHTYKDSWSQINKHIHI